MPAGSSVPGSFLLPPRGGLDFTFPHSITLTFNHRHLCVMHGAVEHRRNQVALGKTSFHSLNARLVVITIASS